MSENGTQKLLEEIKAVLDSLPPELKKWLDDQKAPVTVEFAMRDVLLEAITGVILYSLRPYIKTFLKESLGW
jgi:hypothetical protein